MFYNIKRKEVEKMLWKKQDGAALVLVILMLLVGTILVNALFVTVRSHIRTVPHEEAMSKAFYSADSGVEFIKSNLNKINISAISSGDYLAVQDENDDGELEISFTGSKTWIDSDDLDVDDIKFNIRVDSTSGNPSFISEGVFESVYGKQYTERIKFDISAGSGYKTFNIQDKGVSNHYNESGPGNLTDHINIYDFGADNFIDFAKLFLTGGFFDGNDFADDNSDDVDVFYENSNVDFKNQLVDAQNIIIKNGNLTMKKATINNSIVVIDGYLDFDPPDNYINNSVILVKDYISSQGASASANFDNNMFFIYSNDSNTNGYYLDFRGTGNFNINPGNLPDEYQPDFSIDGWEQL